METSDNVDINHPWYINRPIASLGSSVGVESGSIYVIDYSVDCSHDKPHMNIRFRVAAEGEEPKGKGTKTILGDSHFINLILDK